MHKCIIHIVHTNVEAVCYRLLANNPEVAMESIVQLAQLLTAAQRAEVAKVISALDC